MRTSSAPSTVRTHKAKTRTCKPATGIVRILQAKGMIQGQPDTAEIVINATAYLCRCLPSYVELVKAAGPKDSEPQVYHLPADLSSCDCPDATFANRPGGCKHVKAIAALRAACKL